MDRFMVVILLAFVTWLSNVSFRIMTTSRFLVIRVVNSISYRINNCFSILNYISNNNKMQSFLFRASANTSQCSYFFANYNCFLLFSRAFTRIAVKVWLFLFWRTLNWLYFWKPVMSLKILCCEKDPVSTDEIGWNEWPSKSSRSILRSSSSNRLVYSLYFVFEPQKRKTNH
jgi:hypothetical protein